MDTIAPQSAAKPAECDLCGLALSAGSVKDDAYGEERHFCCVGCRMVYAMLLEAGDVADPSKFKETDLYRRCVAAGVVPASQAQLVELYPSSPASVQIPDHAVEAEGDTATLAFQCRVDGMWCPACAWVIQTALTRIAGVASVQCDFALDLLQCCYDPTKTAPREFLGTVKRLGYVPQGDPSLQLNRHNRGEFIRLLISVVLSVNVMMLSWALYSGFFTDLTPQGIRYLSWPIFLLTAIVFAYGGAPTFRKAWSGVRAGVPGMEALVVMGAGSAFLLSVINFKNGNLHLYFDTAAMLMTLLLLGKFLESRAKERVRRDLESFISLQPQKVRLCTAQFPNGHYVSADRLGVGDCFRIIEGDTVPADGRVLEGRALVDLSSINGEPEPVSVIRGDAVTSGSRIVSGHLDVEARMVGDDAMLGQMIAVVRRSLSQKMLLDSPAKRKLTVFVPLIVILALLTVAAVYIGGASWSHSLVRGITVLVVACPCALGIAVPLANVAGISGARQRGILVRDVLAFKQAEGIDTVVFDKTGTLTEGKWTLENIDLLGFLSHDQVLALAFALEINADHVIARAICDVARQRGITAAPATHIRSHANGITGRYDHQTVKIGSSRYISGHHGVDGILSPSKADGSTVFLSMGNQVQAVLRFSDNLRPYVRETIHALRQMQYDLHLISGDTTAATQRIAATLGVAHYKGDLLPSEKASYIGELQARGAKVAMVGDGINDAPALAQAELAAAVHSGAGLARQVGMITLMRSDPRQLPVFFRWARRVNRKIALNLWWAWLYNLFAVPLAMAGLLSPLVAVSAMLLSSLSVIGNTLLLVRRTAWDE